MTLHDTPNPQPDIDPIHLEKLVELAISLGASDARVIESAIIHVEERLANLCAEPRCPSYGQSASCPPYVSGPAGFRELKQKLPRAVVVRIVVPSSMLHSSDNMELGRFLYELVSTIEQEAINMGYSDSIAFAGGSCKQLFCSDHLECRRVKGDGCRHPLVARASMSGYGVNVFELMESCGWATNLDSGRAEPGEESMSWMAGLVLIGKSGNH